MIVATVAAVLFLFGGSGGGLFGELMTKFAEDPIKNTIVDEQRRELALKSLDVLKDDIEKLNELTTEDIEKFINLVKNYESSVADFDNMLASILEEHKTQIEKIWVDRKAMLVHIQPEEWQTIIESAKAEAQKK